MEHDRVTPAPPPAVNTYHARCAAGVECGGHAWSRDGLTWSNQTVGAFGPAIRWSNGSFYLGAYMERPQVLQAPDGTPISFHSGWGRASYLDSVNWAQLFCVDPSSPLCGPTLTPTPPLVHLTQGGACLVANASGFPCAGGHGNSCPLTLGSCADPTSAWAFDGDLLKSLARGYENTAMNIDCDSCAVGALAKVADASFARELSFDVATGTLQVSQCPGMCLSGGPGIERNAPCEGGEWWLPNAEVALVACSDAAAGGWAVENVQVV